MRSKTRENRWFLREGTVGGGRDTPPLVSLKSQSASKSLKLERDKSRAGLKMQTGEADFFQGLQLNEARTEQRLLKGAGTTVQHVQVCLQRSSSSAPLNVTMREPKRDKNQMRSLRKRDERNGSIQVLSANLELIKSFEQERKKKRTKIQMKRTGSPSS